MQKIKISTRLRMRNIVFRLFKFAQGFIYDRRAKSRERARQFMFMGEIRRIKANV